MTILWDEWAEKYKWELVAGLTGITLIGLGLFLWKSHASNPDTIQVLSASDTAPQIATPSGLMVDVSGSVIAPGVYKLAANSRVEDALRVAGGLSEGADAAWVAQNINRAEKVRDGMKLFIPAQGVSQPQITQTTENKAVANTNININSASAEQLDTLKGVGPVTAQKIISGRPYSNIDELLNKKIVSKTVFAQIKDQIQAW